MLDVVSHADWTPALNQFRLSWRDPKQTCKAFKNLNRLEIMFVLKDSGAADPRVEKVYAGIWKRLVFVDIGAMLQSTSVSGASWNLESLVLNNDAQRIYQHVRWTSGARVWMFVRIA